MRVSAILLLYAKDMFTCIFFLKGNYPTQHNTWLIVQEANAQLFKKKLNFFL